MVPWRRAHATDSDLIGPPTCHGGVGALHTRCLKGKFAFEGGTLLPIIMEMENGRTSNLSFVSFGVIFHLHGFGRKGVYIYILYHVVTSCYISYGLQKPPKLHGRFQT